MNRRRDHLVGSNPVHQQTDCRHIGNRIHRTHLMKMNFRHRNTVGAALGFGDQSIYRKNVLLHLVRHRQAVNNMLDIVHTAVVMWMCSMVIMSMTVHIPGIVIMSVIMHMYRIMYMDVVTCVCGILCVAAVMRVCSIMCIVVVMRVYGIGLMSAVCMGMLMSMIMHILTFLFPINLHGDVCTADAAFTHLLFRDRNARNSQCVQLCYKCFLVRYQFQ